MTQWEKGNNTWYSDDLSETLNMYYLFVELNNQYLMEITSGNLFQAPVQNIMNIFNQHGPENTFWTENSVFIR